MPEETPTPEMPGPELTLIVAATRNMGIGRAGTLPWTGLKKEMAYFARVTKRLPSHHHHHPTQNPSSPALNAVIMGRKTWDSIPSKFRPLKGRLNIVISRSHTSSPPPLDNINPETEPVRVSSLEQAIAYLQPGSGPATTTATTRVFVIGGAQIYAAALRLEVARRVLLTRIMTDFECDTFFPLRLSDDDQGEGEGSPEDDGAGGMGRWVKRSKEELDRWTEETVPEGVQEENQTRYEFQMWERVE